ncbi:HEAT repeat domain-containing protein [Corallococcus exercitus]|uniref:HEAT repeat domain-containing protein n=1 Tax=Corallococcus exercitus TaxID=2316736 RepID=UPI0035D52BA0
MDEGKPLSQDERESTLKAISGDDPDAMIKAARLLAYEESTTPQLLELLKHERRAETRQAILYALAWHTNQSLCELMAGILSDPREAPSVRGQAAEGIAYMIREIPTDSEKFKIAVGALVAALKDPSPEVRYCSIFALGSTRHQPLIPVLEGLLGDHTEVPGWVGTIGSEAANAIERISPDYMKQKKDSP